MILRKIFSFPTLTLLVALTLSAIAAWYSVLGLTAIFAAAVIPIIIMGGSLEVAKVVTTLWLHKYWDRATWKLKLYLIPAVMALAFLTSMGIFGFLSKAHSDQSLVSGDVGAKIELIDEKIKISRENIAMNQQALEQMNSQVDQLLGRTDDDRGANRAVQVRRQQRAERAKLQEEIAQEQENIARLNEEAAPIRAEIRKIEAEVGPIKYIAAMVYGDNPDSNLLERAVRWVIILIVLVFDPLALVLVLAAQSSYRWLDDDLRNRRTEKKDDEKFKEVFLNTKLDEETSEFLDEALSDTLNETEYHQQEEDNYVSEPIQSDTIQTDGVVREDVYEASPSVTDAPGDGLVQNESENDKFKEPVTDNVIKTEGVTLQESDGEYVSFEGKNISKTALQGLRPDLFVAKPDTESSMTNFGTEFPKFAKKGTVFVRVDLLPNKVFKFNGEKWIEISKEITDSYLYDEEYIRYLVAKIETGEYDVDLLSDNERTQIEHYLDKISKS
jgi:NADH dehydrogenase/NADH:ubiquinone oxidoreductase subunit G